MFDDNGFQRFDAGAEFLAAFNDFLHVFRCFARCIPSLFGLFTRVSKHRCEGYDRQGDDRDDDDYEDVLKRHSRYTINGRDSGWASGLLFVVINQILKFFFQLVVCLDFAESFVDVRLARVYEIGVGFHAVDA